MAQNMNTQLKALCHEMEKRGAAEAKLQMRLSFRRGMQQPRKALIRELRKNETFKRMKIQIADAEKAARKAAADAKKLAAAEAKANKPSKVDTAMIKRWSKVLTKGIKRGQTETKKALTQLKQLKTKKRKADAKAVEWYTKAAERGDRKAQYNLAVCYDYGVGVVQDNAKAVEWYTKAAEQGDADAQRCLGECYDPETQDEVGFWNGSELEDM